MLVPSFRTELVVNTMPQLNFALTAVYSGCKSSFILNLYQEHFGNESITKKGHEVRFLKNHESNY